MEEFHTFLREGELGSCGRGPRAARTWESGHYFNELFIWRLAASFSPQIAVFFGLRPFAGFQHSGSPRWPTVVGCPKLVGAGGRWEFFLLLGLLARADINMC